MQILIEGMPLVVWWQRGEGHCSSFRARQLHVPGT